MPLNPIRVTLDNGATLIVKENRTTPAVSILAGVRAGAYDDPGDAAGTAALVARVLDRGTTTRTAADLADDLDGRGASLSVAAGRHVISVSATCLADDFAPVAAIVAGVLSAPAFPEPDVQTRRGELITTIRQDDDDPGAVAVHRLMAELYGAHPYARRVRGVVESVARLSRGDLVAFERRRFSPRALTLVVVGGVAAGDVERALQAALKAWTAEPGSEDVGRPVPEAPATGTRRRIDVPMPDKSQADVAYGFVGIRRSDPDYLPAFVMNNVLGQYALGGRLGDSIRERQGMAYYVYSSLDAGLGPGPLMIRAGVAASNVERAIDSIDRELAAVRSDGFTAKEVGESKQYLIGSLPRQLETNAAIASFLLNADLLGLGLDHDARLPGEMAAVSVDAAVAAGRRLLDPDRATIIVAGPVTS
jgi:zinc protease